MGLINGATTVSTTWMGLELMHAYNKAVHSEQFFRRFFMAVATLPQKINSKLAA